MLLPLAQRDGGGALGRDRCDEFLRHHSRPFAGSSRAAGSEYYQAHPDHALGSRPNSAASIHDFQNLNMGSALFVGPDTAINVYVPAKFPARPHIGAREVLRTFVANRNEPIYTGAIDSTIRST
jgi:hypothetical protein